jgi:UDP-glucuronate 4-epimerase
MTLLNNNKILVTGAAGFIGYHISKKLLSEGYTVIGIDNLNDYYDVGLKKNRLKELGIDNTSSSSIYSNFSFYKLDIRNKEEILGFFKTHKFTQVCHLAAQAGVRYSLSNPDSYIDNNIIGFLNIMEACRTYPVEHLCYASSSSVYGLNEEMPLSTKNPVNHPMSLYAASKKSDEMMAHAYSHLFNIPCTGLRFFTVYGPWGRPDMALFKFTKAILEDKPIDIYNNGNLIRDFTYIDDIVEGSYRILFHPPKGVYNEAINLSCSTAPWKIYNIGNGNPVKLMDFIYAIEEKLQKTAKKKFLPMQAGDVAKTYADTEDLKKAVDYKPLTKIEDGVNNFINWYLEYYKK